MVTCIVSTPWLLARSLSLTRNYFTLLRVWARNTRQIRWCSLQSASRWPVITRARAESSVRSARQSGLKRVEHVRQPLASSGIASGTMAASEVLGSLVARVFDCWIVCEFWLRGRSEARSTQRLPDLCNLRGDCPRPRHAVKSEPNQHANCTTCRRCKLRLTHNPRCPHPSDHQSRK